MRKCNYQSAINSSGLIIHVYVVFNKASYIKQQQQFVKVLRKYIDEIFVVISNFDNCIIWIILVIINSLLRRYSLIFKFACLISMMSETNLV